MKRLLFVIIKKKEGIQQVLLLPGMDDASLLSVVVLLAKDKISQKTYLFQIAVAIWTRCISKKGK